MDSINGQKLQAMKNYKKAQFLYNLIVYSLTALLSCLFYSYLFWFPSMNHFFSIFLPNIYSFFLSPKFLFIVGNVIFLFLVGESKLRRGSHASPATEIYDEYVQKSRSLRQRSSVVEYKKKDRIPEMSANIKRSKIIIDEKTSFRHHKDEKQKEILEQTSDNGEPAGEVDIVEGKLGGVERGEGVEDNLVVSPEDELKRRVEEFIARVNRQRKLEERQVLDRW